MIMLGIGIPFLIYTGMVFFSFPGPYGAVLGIGAYNHMLLFIISLLFMLAGVVSLVLASRDEKHQQPNR